MKLKIGPTCLVVIIALLTPFPLSVWANSEKDYRAKVCPEFYTTTANQSLASFKTQVDKDTTALDKSAITRNASYVKEDASSKTNRDDVDKKANALFARIESVLATRSDKEKSDYNSYKSRFQSQITASRASTDATIALYRNQIDQASQTNRQALTLLLTNYTDFIRSLQDGRAQPNNLPMCLGYDYASTVDNSLKVARILLSATAKTNLTARSALNKTLNTSLTSAKTTYTASLNAIATDRSNNALKFKNLYLYGTETTPKK